MSFVFLFLFLEGASDMALNHLGSYLKHTLAYVHKSMDLDGTKSIYFCRPREFRPKLDWVIFVGDDILWSQALAKILHI